MNISHIIILSTVLFLGIGCNEGNTEEMENELIIEDLVVGEGAEAEGLALAARPAAALAARAGS